MGKRNRLISTTNTREIGPGFLKEAIMRRPDYSGKSVDNLGRLLCDKCNGDGKPDDIRINVDQTYADEPCDWCGSMGERKKNPAAD